jgi:hypothetical protein
MHVVAVMAARLERQQYLTERSLLILRDAEARLSRSGRGVQSKTDSHAGVNLRLRAERHAAGCCCL